jgi:hypothetical protein
MARDDVVVHASHAGDVPRVVERELGAEAVLVVEAAEIAEIRGFMDEPP